MAAELAKTDSPGPGGFDAHHPPSLDLIADCVHCGFCLSTCPTYALWNEEMDSPRGRIYLMKMALEGQVPLKSTFVNHMDNCLGCMACLTSCPSGVKYDRLIEATRAQIERNHPRTLKERLARKLIFEIFPRPDRLARLLVPLRLYQRSGLQSLVRKCGVLKLFPAHLRAMESLIPAAPKATPELPEVLPAKGERRLRVGLLLGCVQRVFFPEVNAATARVLVSEGCEVIIPKDQGCCGALMVHAGQEQRALERARQMIDTFERAQVDAIAINAAGCGSNMKDYAILLQEDPKYADRARTFSTKCFDICEIIGQLEPRAPRHPLALRVAYHDACHLQHAQNVQMQPRALLRRIPGLEVVEVAEAALCCGSAGIYNLVRPEPAKELGARKVRNLLALSPDVVAAGNPGCLLQLRSGMKMAGKPMPVLHTVELLDAAIQGIAANSLRERQS